MNKGDPVWVNDRYYATVSKSFDRVGTVVSVGEGDMAAVRLDVLKPRNGAEVIHLIPVHFLIQRVDRSV